MTFAQLRTLLAVVETGSVRAAAERLVVSQPAVSGALRALERELGVALVARQGRGLRVTPAGSAFADGARRSLGLLDAAARRAKSLAAPERGAVRLFSVMTAAERLLLPMLTGFRLAHPEIEISLNVGNRTSVWRALADHAADMVVAGRPPGSLAARVLATAPNRLVLVAAARARPREQPGRAGAGLEAVTWLLREKGSGTRESTEELLDELGLQPPTMMLGSNGAIEQAVVAGLGVALVPHDALADRLAAGTIVAVECPGTPLDRPWHLVAHANEPLGPSAVLLARALVDSGPFTPTTDGWRALASRRHGA